QRVTPAVPAAVPAPARPFPLLPRGDAGAQFVNDPRDFVSRNARILNTGPLAFLREHVAVAHATGLDLDAHLPGTRLRNLALDDLERGSRLGHLRRLHCCHSDGCHVASFEFSTVCWKRLARGAAFSFDR